MARLGRSFPAPPRVTRGPLSAAPTTAIMRAPRAAVGRPARPRPRTITTYQITASPQPITEMWPRANRRAGPQRPLKGFFPVTPPAQALQRAPSLPVKRQPVPRQQPPRIFVAPVVPPVLVGRVPAGILASKPRPTLQRQRVPRAFVAAPPPAGFRIRLPMVGVGR